MKARRRVAGTAAVLVGMSAVAAPFAACADADGALEQRYAAALRAAVQAQWVLPGPPAPGASCRVSIRQLPGGDVLLAEPMPDCGFDADGRDALVRAVLRAAPLPYAGFERVFSRDLVITFTTPAR